MNMPATAQGRQSYGPPGYTQTLPAHGRQQQPIPHYQPACVHQVEPPLHQYQQQNGMPQEMLDEQLR